MENVGRNYAEKWSRYRLKVRKKDRQKKVKMKMERANLTRRKRYFSPSQKLKII